MSTPTRADRRLRSVVLRVIREDRGDIQDVPGLVILIPAVLFTVLAVMVVYGQHVNAENQVQSAAFAAARDASLSGDAATATPHAIAAARQSLTADGIRCASLQVSIDTSGLSTPLGVTGTVSATVTCLLRYTTYQVPGFPTTSTITQTAVSPTDPYRERPTP